MSEQTNNTPSADETESAAASSKSVSETAAESSVDNQRADGADAGAADDLPADNLPADDLPADDLPADDLVDAVVVEAADDSDPGATSEAKPPPDERSRMLAQISTLEAEIVKLGAEKKDNWDRYLRATADTENVRRRAKRDVDDARIEASGKVLKEMLPVIDNLERAVDHAVRQADKDGDGKADDGGILEGIRLVMRQFSQALERCGVTQVAAQGQPFDPSVHEAISQIETADVPPGSVVQALQNGYKIGERLLRPALVVVAKAPPAPAPEDGQAKEEGGNPSQQEGDGDPPAG